ncbi:MAG: GNAT family N-acetyltransferase [Bacteroidetes bacterium]|nr:GNAT family N-acetyltransferase [Bacteroidota bacterium]
MQLQPTHLRNEWVQLTPLLATDLDRLYAVASDPLIWEQHPNPDRYQRPIFETYFNGALESCGAVLILDAEGTVIGCSRFYDHVPELREVKIGYTFFARSCWGKPYNRSVKQLMLAHAFQYVDRVIFHVGACNIRSQKAMEKIGAVKIGEKEIPYYGEKTLMNFVYQVIRESLINFGP